MNLHLAKGYVERPNPEQYDDWESDGLCQKAVYEHAIWRAKELGARSIIDLGCGNAKKLLPYTSRFSVLGIDDDRTVDRLRGLTTEDFRAGRGFRVEERDLERPFVLGISEPTVIICSDVVEHLRDPAPLLSTIRQALRAGALRAFLSTPCRTHCPGIAKLGPPNNPAHVREWTCKEFQELLVEAGLGVVDHTHVPERPGAEGKGTYLVEVLDA